MANNWYRKTWVTLTSKCWWTWIVLGFYSYKNRKTITTHPPLQRLLFHKYSCSLWLTSLSSQSTYLFTFTINKTKSFLLDTRSYLFPSFCNIFRAGVIHGISNLASIINRTWLSASQRENRTASHCQRGWLKSSIVPKRQNQTN